MASLTEKISEVYNYILDSRDPRTKGWLFSRPTDILGILAVYLIFSLYIGPRHIKNRQPYKLENTIRIYNIIQVILSGYVCYGAACAMIFEDFSFRCQPVNYSVNSSGMRFAYGTWWCFFSKVMDLWDTGFFILRKKMSHVTFLHVYHHTLMVFFLYIGAFYYPGGNPTFLGALNGLVHVFMYSYYFITALGPEYKRYVWWKKHLTQMQIIQFVLVAGHTVPILFRECEYPRWFTGVAAGNAIFFIYLFGKFYLRAYVGSSKSIKKS